MVKEIVIHSLHERALRGMAVCIFSENTPSVRDEFPDQKKKSCRGNNSADESVGNQTVQIKREGCDDESNG